MYMSIEIVKLQKNGITNKGKTRVMKYDGLVRDICLASTGNLRNKLG